MHAGHGMQQLPRSEDKRMLRLIIIASLHGYFLPERFANFNQLVANAEDEGMRSGCK
jgi:hypothetical protein